MGTPKQELVAVILENLPEIADTTQVGNLLGVHRRTIARWVKQGLLQGVRTGASGGKLLIARQALIRRINELGLLNTPLEEKREPVEQTTGGER